MDKTEKAPFFLSNVIKKSKLFFGFVLTKSYLCRRYFRSTKQIITSFICICPHLIVPLKKVLAFDKSKKSKLFFGFVLT